MKVVNVREAKTHFSKLLAKVEQKRERILSCRNGQPVAELVPHRLHGDRSKTDPKLRKAKIGYDPVDPLTFDEWPKAAR